MKFIISGGETGGHIIPAISIAKNLQKFDQEIIYIGNYHSLEQKLTCQFTFKGINVQKMYRRWTIKHILFPFRLVFSIFKSYYILKKVKADAFVGTGGFVCGPVGLAFILYNFFHKKKRPLFLHEQNSYPGITTRFLGKYAKIVFLGNSGAKKYFKKSFYAGNPINKSFKKEGNNVLLIGGSQGSSLLNATFEKIIHILIAKGYSIDWQVGENNLSKYQKYSSPKINIFGFSNEIENIYNKSKIAITRCGALTLAELEVRKIPSVLVPLAISAGNHQFYNAENLHKSGSGIMLQEKYFTDSNLLKTIEAIEKNYKKMQNSFRSEIHHEKAGLNIAQKIIEQMHSV